MATLFGSGIKRHVDPRLITGRATYTDDVKLPGLLHAAVLRSTYAHAKLGKVDVTKATKAPGVVAVFTGADVKDKLNTVPCAWNVPNCDLKVPPHPLLAIDRVRYVGDGVALVVAESRAAARDALDLIDVDYDALDVVVDPEKATQQGAPELHPEVPGNVAFTWKVAGGDAAKAFAEAPVTVEQRIVQNRLLPTA
ncbi:MAG: carbon monoxide dehydrogenase, partial [Gemmatimonadetes bacterium]